MKKIDKIYTETKRLIADYGISGLINNAGAVLVCYSGGADSTVLLHIMKNLSLECGFRLYAAHMNHMLRGSEADRDQKFCESECQKLNIPLFTARRRADLYTSKNALSAEDGARHIRYGFFDQIINELQEALRLPVTAVTAHNADDNMETVIFNLCRGSGGKGLAGIPPVRGKFVRPLLYVCAEDIRMCCEQEKFQFVTDSTNLSDDYTRNKLRHWVTPVLRELFPSACQSVSRACRSIRSDCEYLEKEAEKKLDIIISGGRASRKALCNSDDALLFRIISILFERAGGSSLTMKLYEIIKSYIKSDSNGRLDLPGNIVMICNDAVSFEKKEKYEVKQKENYHLDITEGNNFFPELAFGIKLFQKSTDDCSKNENIYKISIHTFVDFDKINGKLYVRPRESGDRYRYGGVNRSVKKLFCDKKIPYERRERLPLICDENGILWIPGFPPRDSNKIEGDTTSNFDENKKKPMIFEYYEI